MASTPTHQQIAQLAHQLWTERGCPDGTPEIDWHQAEGLLQMRLYSHAPARTDGAVARPRATRTTRRGVPHGES